MAKKSEFNSLRQLNQSQIGFAYQDRNHEPLSIFSEKTGKNKTKQTKQKKKQL